MKVPSKACNRSKQKYVPDLVQEAVKEIPLAKRKTEKGFANELKVSQDTLRRWRKEGL